MELCKTVHYRLLKRLEHGTSDAQSGAVFAASAASIAFLGRLIRGKEIHSSFRFVTCYTFQVVKTLVFTFIVQAYEHIHKETKNIVFQRLM